MAIDSVPVVFADVGCRRRRLLDPCVVEGHVEAAEGLDGRLHGGFEVLGAGHVAADGDDLPARCLDQACRLGVGLLVDIGDHHAGTLMRKRESGRAADAAGRSGHEGDLVGEPSVLVGMGLLSSRPHSGMRGSAGSLCGVSAVDGKGDPGDETGAGAGEPQYGGGDLVGSSEACHRCGGGGLGDVEFALAIMSVTIGVSMVPGQMALMRIPRGAYSRAALLVRPSTPCLEAWYAARPGRPTRPPREEQLTIAPLPWLRIWRARASCRPTRRAG